ncbi:complement component 1 Q subcomponent-binding protein, mitochondrial-like [Acanthaster planci]|uniref:Complement component 1 Q subcomponent-binding protein, mitochondrial-like n=1 Tax=Acanthaster planci TaxID=133434 RepID=A0A8B7ZJN2_ACAPL|nr:complement component 1 Q subcomponent-binding protein, mitochondrial-like [Acanthaster planci]
MAFSVTRNFASVAGRMLTQCRYTTSATSKCLLSIQKDCQMSRPFTRSIWYLCNNHSSKDTHPGGLEHVLAQATKLRDPSKSCSCGCAGMHTQGDEELAKFLKEEIQLEKDSRQFPDVPQIGDFQLSQEGAVATLTKKKDGETVKVMFNLNHSVEEEPQEDKPEEEAASKLRSYPEFTVDITKDTQSTLTISCRFDLNEVEPEGEEGPESNDLFMIDEVSIQDGQASESTYRVGSEVMDANLYNFLMNTLEERGITDEFVEKLSDLSSALEHKLYIEFLQKLHKIAKF